MENRTQITDLTLKKGVWPENVRYMPADIIRSGLFKPIKSTDREALKKEPIGSIDGHTITYSGETLSIVDDWKVIKELIHHQQGFSIELGYKISRGSLVAGIFGNVSSYYYQKLEASLDRMLSGTLNFDSADRTISIKGVSIIRKVAKIEHDNKVFYHILLEPEVVKLLSHAAGITDKYENANLSMQAIKTKDLILSMDPNESITLEKLKTDILCSNSTMKNFRYSILPRISDQLIAAQVLTGKIVVEMDGSLQFDLCEKHKQKGVQESQLDLFE